MKNHKLLIIVILVLFVPVAMALASGERTNPPIEREVKWDSPLTQELFYQACADCHSHETKWPWYTKFAPSSWLAINHVNEGREAFNISTLDMGEADEVAETIIEGEMPPKDYQLLHPEARLSPPEKEAFASGLQKTFGGEKESGAENGGEREDDDGDDD